MDSILLKVQNLTKTFPVKAGFFSIKKLNLKAVDRVSFDLFKGETLGMVGESGCGKSTIGRSILRLYEPDGGRVFLNPVKETVDAIGALDTRIEDLQKKLSTEAASARDCRNIIKSIKTLKAEAAKIGAKTDILSMSQKDLKHNRRKMQIVFQDPWASLNPRMLVRDIVSEGPLEFGLKSKKEIDSYVKKLLDTVGLPVRALNRYPHEFSGGQRQRIGIARALSVEPSLIVCDEPVSALDVSIQAQIINLLMSLQEDFGLTYLFIAHGLSVVQYVSDRVAVMYLGRICETAKSTDLYSKPMHPYTISLLSAAPVADPNHVSSQIILEGDVPSPVNPPSGCTFHPRCPHAIEQCSKETPILTEVIPGRHLACFNSPALK
jgi:peptide/nickel transport system ATP-binding protein